MHASPALVERLLGRLRSGRDLRLGHAGIGQLAAQLLGRIGGGSLDWCRLDRLDSLGGARVRVPALRKPASKCCKADETGTESP